MTDGGLQKLEGQVVTIDHAARKVAVRNRDGVITALVWKQGLDGKMGKLKEHFFQTFLHMGDLIDDCHYLQKPADWPQQQSSGKGNWQGKPRNEKMIVLQSSLKVCAELFRDCHVPDTQDFDSACNLVVEKAIEMTERLMKAGGA